MWRALLFVWEAQIKFLAGPVLPVQLCAGSEPWVEDLSFCLTNVSVKADSRPCPCETSRKQQSDGGARVGQENSQNLYKHSPKVCGISLTSRMKGFAIRDSTAASQDVACRMARAQADSRPHLWAPGFGVLEELHCHCVRVERVGNALARTLVPPHALSLAPPTPQPWGDTSSIMF